MLPVNITCCHQSDCTTILSWNWWRWRSCVAVFYIMTCLLVLICKNMVIFCFKIVFYFLPPFLSFFFCPLLFSPFLCIFVKICIFVYLRTFLRIFVHFRVFTCIFMYFRVVCVICYSILIFKNAKSVFQIKIVENRAFCPQNTLIWKTD